MKDFYHFSLSPKAGAYYLAHLVWANCTEEVYILSLATFTQRLHDLIIPENLEYWRPLLRKTIFLPPLLSHLTDLLYYAITCDKVSL